MKLWLRVLDGYYYNEGEEAVDEIQKHLIAQGLERIESLVPFYVFERISKEQILAQEVVISPFLPSELYSDGLDRFYTIIEIPNKHGLLTETEYKMGITEEQKLEKELGLKVMSPNVTFDSMAGAEHLVAIVDDMLHGKAIGNVFKGILLVGIAGTGKSFFAKCLGGQLKRPIIELNLAKLSYLDNPVKGFEYVISFLERRGGKYILWLDEIEKMFGESEKSKHLLNAFLTLQNELGNTIDVDIIVVATANNIERILEKNPETFRAGRFDLRFFLNFPTLDTGKKVLALHIDHINKGLRRNFIEGACSLLADDVGESSPYREYLIPHRDIFEEVRIRSKADILTKHGKSTFIRALGEHPDIERLAKGFVDRFTLYFDQSMFMEELNSFKFWESDKAVATTNFVYTHAEIEQIAKQLFIINSETKMPPPYAKDATLPEIKAAELEMDRFAKTIIENNIPLAKSAQKGIEIMMGARDFFINIE